MNLPGYSPDFNADEAVWGWAREEATGNLCLGSRAAVQERVRQIPGRAVQPERRGETALPDGPAIKGRNTPARLPPRFPAPGKCTIPPWLWFSHSTTTSLHTSVHDLRLWTADRHHHQVLRNEEISQGLMILRHRFKFYDLGQLCSGLGEGHTIKPEFVPRCS